MYGGVINENTAPLHHFFHVSQAQRVSHVSTHASEHDFQWVMQPLQDLVQGAVDQTVAETTVAQIFECYFVYSCLMPKAAESVANLPISVQISLKVLGEHLRLGRKRRKESLRSWTLRMNVSVPTFVSMERGDPQVSMGVYATALWLIGQDDALRTLAAPENDAQALAKEMLVIQNLPLARGVFVLKEQNMAAEAVYDSRPDRWGERIIRNLYKPPVCPYWNSSTLLAMTALVLWVCPLLQTITSPVMLVTCQGWEALQRWSAPLQLCLQARS